MSNIIVTVNDNQDPDSNDPVVTIQLNRSTLSTILTAVSTVNAELKGYCTDMVDWRNNIYGVTLSDIDKMDLFEEAVWNVAYNDCDVPYTKDPINNWVLLQAASK